MKRNLNLIILFLATIGLCLFVAGCSDNDTTTTTTTTTITETPPVATNYNYSLVYQNEQLYIVFEDNEIYDKYWTNQLADASFSSVEEFKDAVTNKKLTKHQISIVVTAFPRDEIGTPICDIDNLYTPILPSGATITEFSWRGESYTYRISLADGSCGYFMCTTKESYDILYQREYERFTKRSYTVTNNNLESGKKVLTHYHTNCPMYAIYSILNGTKQITIYEYSSDNSKLYGMTAFFDPSETKDTCFKLHIYNPSESPSAEWLLSFGVEKHIGNSTANQ